MIKLIQAIALCVMFAATAHARELTDDQWREDITAAAEAIREHHPDPFRGLTSEEFDEQVTALIEDLPGLSDKDAALRLAALISLIEDGHTRLALPRAIPELGFNPAHSQDKPAHDALMFSSLPFRFYLFEEGLFIVEAAAGFSDYIGAKVVKFGNMPAEDAIAAIRPILYAENDYSAKLYAADRLSLPDVLKHFGVIDNADLVSLTLERNGETEIMGVTPHAGGGETETVQAVFTRPPLAMRNKDQKKWHTRIPGEKAWYIKFDELEMFSSPLIADFMTETLRQAQRAGAEKVLLDLRDNHGGTASFNSSIINALSRSEYNEYGRLYVLVGRETFSAASMLMVAFEEYAHAVFVGEPSGARPTSYGDPMRVQLPNSGLTLRTSTLVWPSSFAGDFRPFIDAHVDAPPNAADYFSGEDPAIKAALAYSAPSTPAAQMAELFDKGKLQSGLIRFYSWLRSPIEGAREDAVDELIDYGHDYLDKGELQKGRFMMVMARDYFPTSAEARAGLGRAMELNDNLESAKERYEEALELDRRNRAAREGLARLSAQQ